MRELQGTLWRRFFVCLTVCCSRTNAWSWSPLTSDVTPSVSGHSVASDDPLDRVYLFGGLTGSAGSPTTNDLYCLSKKGWQRVEETLVPQVEVV